MTRRPEEHRRALILALVVTVLWSSSWVIIRFGLDDEGLDPLTFAGLRYVVAAMVLVGLVVARPTARAAVRSLDPREVGELALLGLVFIAITQGAQFIAIDNQPAATTSLVLSLTPLLVALTSGLSLGERATGRQLVGAGLVVGGAVLYFSGSLAATAIGMVAATVGLVANVSASLLGRRINREHHRSPLVTTTVSMAIGAVILLGTGVAIEGLPRVTLTAAVIIGWLAVVNTALAFTMWNHSLRHLGATESAAINNTMLIQIAVLAWIFLGETPSAIQVVGILAVTAGISLAQRLVRRRVVVPPPA